MNSLVSVIIPAYNCSKFILFAIDSVLEQTYKNFELIVVDDGSTDNTANIVSKYKDKLEYILQDNGGVSKARNTGIINSNGSYIAFLDADDVWEKNKLEIQMKLFEQFGNVDLIFCSFLHTKYGKIVPGRTFQETYNIFREYKINIENIFDYNSTFNCCDNKNYFYWGNIYKYLFLGNFILPSSILLKRNSLSKTGLFDERYRVAEETEFFLRFSKLNTIGFIDCPLLRYEIPESENLSGKKNMEKLIKNALQIQIDSLMANYEEYKKNVRFFESGISTTYCRLAYYYLSEHRRDDARRYAVHAMRMYNRNFMPYMIMLSSLFPNQYLEYLAKIKKLLKEKLKIIQIQFANKKF